MSRQLNLGNIIIHPFIIAEIALGSLKGRARVLSLLDQLPEVQMAQINEVRTMMEVRRLYSLGIGLIDAHLIASVFLNPPTLLWSRDKQLRRVSERLGIHANLP